MIKSYVSRGFWGFWSRDLRFSSKFLGPFGETNGLGLHHTIISEMILSLTILLSWYSASTIFKSKPDRWCIDHHWPIISADASLGPSLNRWVGNHNPWQSMSIRTWPDWMVEVELQGVMIWVFDDHFQFWIMLDLSILGTPHLCHGQI